MNVNNDAGLLVGINEVSGIIEDSTANGMVPEITVLVVWLERTRAVLPTAQTMHW